MQSSADNNNNASYISICETPPYHHIRVMLPARSYLHQIKCVIPNINVVLCGIAIASQLSVRWQKQDVTCKEHVYSVSLYWISEKKRGLLEKNNYFLTWDSPDNLRGVSQTHKGELVEPPGANVPNLNWAPFPLVHNLLPGVAIWLGKNRA